MHIDLGRWHLRPYRETDVAALVKYANNPRVACFLRDRFPHPYTEEAGRQWIQRVQGQQPPVNFAIADCNELIGGIGLELRHGVYRHSAEIGYWLGEPFWGKGIATAAVRTVVAYGFQDLGLERIDAGVFANNPASARVLEKSGFLLEGSSRRAVLKHGNLLDELRYAILRKP